MINGEWNVVFTMFGARIASNLAFSVHSTLESTGSPDIRFHVAKPQAITGDEAWYHRYYRRSNGQPWLSCARLPSAYLLREHNVGDFVVTLAGDVIVCHPMPGISTDTIFETFLYPVLPLVFNLRGLDGFHAAAVQIGDCVTAFSGPSGAGKSTLAAYLHTLGYRVITDEYLLVESGTHAVKVHPGHSELRLWPSSVEGLNELNPLKGRFDALSQKHIFTIAESDRNLESTMTLDSVYFLERLEDEKFTHDIMIETLRDTRGFLHLMDQSYRLDLSDKVMLERQMTLFSRMVRNGHVKLLRMGWGFDLLPQAAELVIREALGADCHQKPL